MQDLTAGQLHEAGDAFTAAGDYEQALAAYQAAAARAPDSLAAHYNAANMLRVLHRFDEAIAWYDRAIALRPDLAIAHHNRAICLLHKGDLLNGFRAYEWRKLCPTFDDPRYRLPRQWAGQRLTGARLFIYPELFQGDLIQFCRYARLAELAGARVQLAAPAAMHRLLATLSPTIELLPEAAAPGDYDYAAALMSLPAAFGTTLETVPKGVYLAAEPERAARWRARIGEGGFKVGIVWQGTLRAPDRPFPLAAARALAQTPGVRLISLQKHAGLEQLDSLPSDIKVERLEAFDEGADAFLDTAAAITACDLVVTIDTSVAHLAGALGARTWVALPYGADWRWFEGRDDSPWYANTRLFRQPARGDWSGVFDRMAGELAKLAG